MSTILFGLGVFVLLFTLVDLVWTTLTLQGAGPITRLLGRGVWGLLRFAHEKRRGGFHTALAQSGWILLVLTAIVWVMLSWAGWALIFGSDPTAVVNDRTRQPANLAELLYFCGFAVYTLGVGDYVPNGGLWQVLTPLATIHGFILVTLSVTYFIQVLSAVVGDRTAAHFISSLGSSPTKILRNAWNGRDFSSLSHALAESGLLLAEHAQQHAAYPVLHYFHHKDKQISLLLQVAILGETLARIELVQGKGHGINPFAFTGAMAGACAAWEGLPGPVRVASDEAPPLPPTAELTLPNLPPPSHEEIDEWSKRTAERRASFRAVALSGCWTWTDVDASVT